MEITEGVRFDSLGLSQEILRAIEKRKLTMTTPVQAGCIPPMMEWRDVIAKAPTGTGKTFAYGIPIIEHVDTEDESVQAVILWANLSPASVRCACTAGSPSAGRSTC
jgi:ATP-dependent RNA helicase DeaD